MPEPLALIWILAKRTEQSCGIYLTPPLKNIQIFLGITEWRVTCGMLVWQCFRWYFPSVDHHPCDDALGEQVDITAGADRKMLCEFVTGSWGGGGRYSIFFCAHSHVGDLNIDVFPLDVIALHLHNEFQLIRAVLGQNLVARHRHLDLVCLLVEGGQHLLNVGTLSCE